VQSGELLTTAEAADWLGVPTRTLHRLIDRGELTPIRRGRQAHFTLLELELFVEAHRVRPGSLGDLYPDDPDPT
jgi:excisionase family DNA binding protein